MKDLQYGSPLVLFVYDHSVTVQDQDDGRDLITVKTASEFVMEIVDKRGSKRKRIVRYEPRAFADLIHDLESFRDGDKSESGYAIYTVGIALVEAMLALEKEQS